MIRWFKEKDIFIFGFNAITIKLSEQKMEQEEKKLLLIQPPKIIIQAYVLIKVVI